MFKKILIANRGEIACRVIRTCQRLGIKTVAVYSDPDRHALHVQMADEAVHIGPARAAESYLDAARILAAAKATGAEAVHPGYGFLSENEDFAKACKQAGIIFIGPTPEAIELMGSKSTAKALMEKAGVPVTPGYHGDKQDLKTLEAEAKRIGYPLLIKAVAGGGGKGMRIVREASEFKAALEGAQREAKAAFGDDKVLIEKYLERPRHIEFQVFGDTHGNVVHLFERECSLQRRFQKVVEETPSPFLDAAMRRAMGEAAVAAAKAVKYVNAGTIEFIVGQDKSFYFMEMNTRLQVEHPITEETTGVDLVEWQLKVAAGGKLPLTQDQIRQKGHAIEVRLYAENPDKGFLPATGRLEVFQPAEGEAVRVDTGVHSGDDISIHYDPMIAKITVRGNERAEAIAHLNLSLAETAVFGLVTNLPLLRGIARHPDFAAGKFDTGFIERELKTLLTRPPLTPQVLAMAMEDDLLARDSDPAWAADGWRLGGSPGVRYRAREYDGTEHVFTVRAGHECLNLELDGQTHSIEPGHFLMTSCRDERQLVMDGVAYHFTLTGPYAQTGNRVSDEAAHPLSPMPGRVVAVHVKAGDRVEPGQALLVLEGMKMEYTVKAGVAGVIEKVLFETGAMVNAEAPLVDIKPDK
ncbi:MAG TPA: acetyl/propionyl/methylcrotonyl-CoA carboxylase subunit alpha [Gammaproteobacteria bacterium]|nr:acetyl/propionyl/methylcrotonyl-CoA carboxylase subunit alpha [Gammaproteobacteria bacterium]